MLVKLLHILSNFKQNENNECVMTIDFTFIIALGKSWLSPHILALIRRRQQHLAFTLRAHLAGGPGGGHTSYR